MRGIEKRRLKQRQKSAAREKEFEEDLRAPSCDMVLLTTAVIELSVAAAVLPALLGLSAAPSSSGLSTSSPVAVLTVAGAASVWAAALGAVDAPGAPVAPVVVVAVAAVAASDRRGQLGSSDDDSNG